MQIRLTVLGPRSGRAGRGCDVLVTAPEGTPLGTVAGALATAAGSAQPGGRTSGTSVALYSGTTRLPATAVLGVPPLVDGALLSLHAPAEQHGDHGRSGPFAASGQYGRPPVESARLHVTGGPDAGGVHLLHGGPIRIGRSAAADVPLDDPDVSRLHCELDVGPDGQVTVADLESTNGTVLDGRPVGPRPVPFPPGSLLQIGESTLRLDPAHSPAPPALAAHPDGDGHVRVSLREPARPAAEVPQPPGAVGAGSAGSAGSAVAGGPEAGRGSDPGAPDAPSAPGGSATATVPGQTADAGAAYAGGTSSAPGPNAPRTFPAPGGSDRPDATGAPARPGGSDTASGRGHGGGTGPGPYGSGGAAGSGPGASTGARGHDDGGDGAASPLPLPRQSTRGGGDHPVHDGRSGTDAAPGPRSADGTAHSRTSPPSPPQTPPAPPVGRDPLAGQPHAADPGAGRGAADPYGTSASGGAGHATGHSTRDAEHAAHAAAAADPYSTGAAGGARAHTGPAGGGRSDTGGQEPGGGRLATGERARPGALRPRGVGAISAWAKRHLGGARRPEPAAEDGAEAEALRARWPDPAEVLLTVLGPGRRLWERGPGHPDALTVRLGTADLPSSDGLRRLPAVPFAVDLRAPGTSALTLAGPRPRLSGLARAVLAQMCALHSPGVLEVVLLSADRARGADQRAEEWAWLNWLPHVRPAHGQDCRLLLAFDRDQAEARTAEVVRRLESGPLGPSWAAAPGSSVAAAAAAYTGPYTLVVVDGDPGSAGLRESVARIAEAGPSAGVHVLCLAEAGERPVIAHGALARLSGDVATTLRVEPAVPLPGHAPGPGARGTSGGAFAGGTAVTHGGGLTLADTARGAARGATGGATGGTGGDAAGDEIVVDAVSADWAEHFARALAPLREADADAAGGRSRYALPSTVRLLDELDLAVATPAKVGARWSSASAADPAATAVLGVGAGGRVAVDLVAEGPHAAVGGAPGAGKTELLRSLTAALAAGERPDRLALVLVDGAGQERGAGLTACAELPHVTAHLVASDPVRMREFAQALGAELKRRAELLDGRDFAAWHAERLVAAAIPHQGGRSGRATAAADASASGGGRTERTGGAEPGQGPHDARDGGPFRFRAAAGGGEDERGEERGPQRGAGRGTGRATGTGPERAERAAEGRRGERPGRPAPHADLPRLVVVVDDFDALIAPALGAPGRPAAGSVVRALEAVARDGERLGVHLVTATERPERTAGTDADERARLRIALRTADPESAALLVNVEDPAGLDDAVPGRGYLRRPGGAVSAFQTGRVSARIPRTATLRPTVVALEWERMGDPPARRQVRELGNGPTDLALLASALQRAAEAGPCGDPHDHRPVGG